MVKALQTLPSLSYLEDSLSTHMSKHYNITGCQEDKELVLSLSNNNYPIYFLVFSEKDGKPSIEYIYLAEGHKETSSESISLKVSVLQKISNQSMIDNFVFCSEIDLTQDFKLKSYVTLENSPSLVKQINFIAYTPQISDGEIFKNYKSISEERELHPLAQKNEYCIREHAESVRNSDRSEFQRDYERIVHSKAFRRMVDKAQIFSADKGDHYRTRMTHSIVVNQIARGISSALKLNNSLTEAIALGHDLGHTPFGHQGERTLRAILTGEKPLLKEALKEVTSYGGFKHNYQSLRVATRLEEKYLGFNGLNLSFQTLEGMWKHTKTNSSSETLENFATSAQLLDYLKLNPNASTLEGQVVFIADEIAQRSHDLEDAFSANNLSVEELKNYLLLSKMDSLRAEIEKIEESFKEAERSHKVYADKDELLQGRISSQIIHFFISDVVENSTANMKAYILEGNIGNFNANNHTLSETLIGLSPNGSRLCKYLEKIISTKVINSTQVSLFDANGATVIEALFIAYYNNPRLLHQGTQHRIMQDFRQITKNVFDFEEANPKSIENEWGKITRARASKDECDIVDKEYCKKNKALVRNIADFIAGMTDSYALNEYNKIRR
jgi:deoxyguanosinetriphosphate triphosphohydrolase, putative